MSSKKIKSTKNSEKQTNMDNESKISHYYKNLEYFGQTHKIDEDDFFNGKIGVANSTKEIKNKNNIVQENVSTKPKTYDLIPLTNKNLFEKLPSSKGASEQIELLGKKIERNETKKRNQRKRKKNPQNNEGKENTFNINPDNSFKSAMKAPFIFIIFLINQLGNIKLENINLKKLLGGVKKNKIIFDLKLYQMLCIDDEGKNKEIIQNANPDDEILYKYFLTRTYRFLFDKYINCCNIFYVNGTFRHIDSFPTFDKVLEHRKKRYYNIHKGITLKKKIEEFKAASSIVHNNFKGCVEREPQNEKIFFIFKYPKIRNLDKSDNNIYVNNHSYVPKFKLNIDYIKLQDYIINNLKDEENPKYYSLCFNNEKFEDIKIEKKDQKIKKENNIFNIGNLHCQNKTYLLNIDENENFNNNLLIEYPKEMDNEIIKEYNQTFSNDGLSRGFSSFDIEFNEHQNLNNNSFMTFNNNERILSDLPQKNNYNFFFQYK
jgi:hypothetical protein